MTIGALIAMALAAVGSFTEPATEETFASTLTIDGTELALTGADVRRVYGYPVYAMAHYAQPAHVVANANPEALLTHWVTADCVKALVLRGTRDVPARGIRYSWRQSLRSVGYTGPNRDGFAKAFQTDFDENSELVIVARPDGTLTATQNGVEIGRWTDLELCHAVWALSIGEDSEVDDRTNLARLTQDHDTLAAAN